MNPARLGVEGATDIAMYDTPEYVKQAVAPRAALLKRSRASSASNFVGPVSAQPATEVAAAAGHQLKRMHFVACLHKLNKGTNS